MRIALRHLAPLPLVAAAILVGCGGGGGGGGSSPVLAPAAVTTTPASNATTPPSTITTTLPTGGGFAPATGPVTTLSGSGGSLGSTITNAANTAVFVVGDASTPTTAPSAGASLATYALTVTESGGQSTSATRRASNVAVADRSASEIRRSGDPVLTSNLRDALRGFSRHATIGRTTQGTRATLAAVNDAKTFQLQGGNISGTSASKTIAVPTHLLAQTAHANVWLADADANATEFPSGVVADMQAVATRMEAAYAVETAAFGSFYTTHNVQFQECSASGTPLNGTPDPGVDTTAAGADPHMNIIVTNALAGTGEGGYFYGADLFSQSEANCITGAPPTVNDTRMIVIGSDQYPVAAGFSTNKESYWLNEDMPQTVGHELQHYLHFANKYLEQVGNDINNPNAGTIDNAFIDEGCSVLAQDLVAAGNDPREPESPSFVRSFLLEPDLFSLTSFTGYQPDPASTSTTAPYGYFHNTAGNYGLSYLFVRYLYDRFGGATALHAIYAEKSQTGNNGIDVGPATSAALGEAFPQLYDEFTAALAVHVGGAGPEITTDKRFSFAPFVVLRGQVDVFSRRTGIDTRHVVQPGPLNPEVFSANLPLPARVSLSPGQAVTLKLISGASVFITPANTPASGATLRAQVAAPALQGSLGQGPIPTPTPAFF